MALSGTKIELIFDIETQELKESISKSKKVVSFTTSSLLHKIPEKKESISDRVVSESPRTPKESSPPLSSMSTQPPKSVPSPINGNVKMGTFRRLWHLEQ